MIVSLEMRLHYITYIALLVDWKIINRLHHLVPFKVTDETERYINDLLRKTEHYMLIGGFYELIFMVKILKFLPLILLFECQNKLPSV